MRRRGKAIDRKKFDRLQPIKADVQIHQDLQSSLGRPTVIANALEAGSTQSGVPTIFEAQVMGMGTNGLVISGIEFIDGVAYAQSLHCQIP